MKDKKKPKRQAKQAKPGKPTAQAAEDPAKEKEFRLVRLDNLVRGFQLRLLAGPDGAELDVITAHFIEEYSSSLGWPEVTFVRDVKDPEPPCYASPAAEEQAIRETIAQARICLDSLRAIAADGNRNALSELVQLLARNVAWVEGYSHREKGNLKKLAGLHCEWPVMLNRRPRKQRQAADYLARIGLVPKYDPALGWFQFCDLAKTDDATLPRFDNPGDKGHTFCEMSYSAGRLLEELQLYVAEGNMRATANFLKLLEANVTWLHRYSIRDKGNLKAIASRAQAWPVMMARSPLRTEIAVEYLERIEQGTKAQISLSPKWGNSWGCAGAIATHYARGIREAVRTTRNFFRSYDKKLETNGSLSRAAWAIIPQWIRDAGKLAPLTKESAPQWFKIGWQLLVEKHNGHPENDKQLGKLCDDYRANKYARRYAKIAGPFSSKEILNRKESPPATAAADRRSRIKERIRQALVSLAPLP